MNNKTHSFFLILFFLILGISTNVVSGQNYSKYQNGNNGINYRRGNTITYEWIYTDAYNEKYSFNFDLYLGADWDYMQKTYKKLKHQHGTYKKFIKQDPFKNTLIVVANQLRRYANKYDLNEGELALSFVQSLPYQEGMRSYQRYAVETLIDGRGDCSDTAVLYAAILGIWNYDCIFLLLPNHLAVGVWSTNYDGCYWPYRGRKYYYCDTTASDSKIGWCDEYGNSSAEIEMAY